MTCAEIMTRNPYCVCEDDTIGDAAMQIVARNYINLPVVDADGRLCGVDRPVEALLH